MTTQLALDDKTRIRLLWAGFAFLYVMLAVLLGSVHPSADEIVHYGQINRFDHGDFRVAYKYLTMLPGYHLVMSSVLWATGERSLEAARLLNAIFGVLAILAFHLLRKRIWPEESSLLTLQFALLPILLPYDFLVYTDVMSLGLVLAATAATVRSRHVLAGALMIAAMAVRQTNVIWLPLLAGIATVADLAAAFIARHARPDMAIGDRFGAFFRLLGVERPYLAVGGAGNDASGLFVAHRQSVPRAVHVRGLPSIARPGRTARIHVTSCFEAVADRAAGHGARALPARVSRRPPVQP